MMPRDRIVGIAMLLFFLATALLPGQSDAGENRNADTMRHAGPTVIDEEHDLAIEEKRIDLGELHASMALELNDVGHLNLHVGVGITADDVEIVLRKVYGTVRFRATLEPFLQRVRGLRERIESTR